MYFDRVIRIFVGDTQVREERFIEVNSSLRKGFFFISRSNLERISYQCCNTRRKLVSDSTKEVEGGIGSLKRTFCFKYNRSFAINFSLRNQ